MNGFLWAALGIVGGFGLTALGDMVSEEVRDRLNHLPHAILRLAARWLDPTQRNALYKEVWLPDLDYLLKGEESRPITRLFIGTWFAVGILAKARSIRRDLPRAAQAAPNNWPDPVPGDESDVLLRQGSFLRPIQVKGFKHAGWLVADPQQRPPITSFDWERLLEGSCWRDDGGPGDKLMGRDI